MGGSNKRQILLLGVNETILLGTCAKMTPLFFVYFRGYTVQFTFPTPRRIVSQTEAVRRFWGRFFGGRGANLGGIKPKMSKKGGGHFGT